MKINRLLLLFITCVGMSCSNDDTASKNTSKQELQQKLNSAIDKFPGLSLSVKSEHENYTLVAGDAIAGELPMGTESLHYMQSISKTFTSVAVLKLMEEGKINLDSPISNYLPKEIYSNLANGTSITVRQLMNMTSGLPDYIDDADFLNDVLTGPLPMPSEQVLGYVLGKPANFPPGSSFGYSNINYHLLALIIDGVTENGHREFITTKVINAAGLKNTRYIAGSGITAPPAGTVGSYRNEDGIFINVDDLQLGTVLSFIGDDGIVATPEDISTFYWKLLHDKTLLSPVSLSEMQNTVNYQGQPIYGLGLHYYKTASGLQAIGHEGSGAGAAAYAFWFPQKNMTIVLCTNLGTLNDSEKESQFMALWYDITNTILM